MTDRSHVAAVFLDVGGVFFLPHHDRVHEVLAAEGLARTRVDLDRAHYAGVHAQRASQATADAEDVWGPYARAYAAELHDEADVAQAEAALLGLFRDMPRGLWSRLVPSAVSGLRALAATGVALAIVSNFNGTLERSLRRNAICQVGPGDGVPVAAVIDSGAVGIAKPDPGIFTLALDAVGVEAARAVHVGDTVAADVVGARAAGVRPLHLDPYDHCPDRTDHEHVREVGDVLALL